MRRPLRSICFWAAVPLVVATCSGADRAASPVQPESTPRANIAVSPSPSATIAAATPSGALDGIEPPFPCYDDDPCDLPPATYAMTGQHAFLRGLILTVPVHSKSPENGLGGFGLTPDGSVGGLLLWKDVTPVDSHGTPLQGIDASAQGLIGWLQHDPDFVTSAPRKVSIGGSIPSTTLLLGVSPSAKNADPDCPVAVCVAVLTDTAHWDVPYAIGRQADPLYVRLYVADVTDGTARHTFIVFLDGAGAAGLKTLQPIADSIIKSIRLPAGWRPV